MEFNGNIFITKIAFSSVAFHSFHIQQQWNIYLKVQTATSTNSEIFPVQRSQLVFSRIIIIQLEKYFHGSLTASFHTFASMTEFYQKNPRIPGDWFAWNSAKIYFNGVAKFREKKKKICKNLRWNSPNKRRSPEIFDFEIFF